MRLPIILFGLITVIGQPPAQAAKDPFGNFIDPRGTGCVTADTLVLLNDGREKPISELQKSDELVNAQGQRVVLAQLVAGPEKTLMIQISTPFGKRIIATEGHPFYGRSGLKRADEFLIGDQILTTNGFESVSDVKTVSYDDDVFNVVVASPRLSDDAATSSWNSLRR